MQKSAFQEQKLAAYDTRQVRPTSITALLSTCAQARPVPYMLLRCAECVPKWLEDIAYGRDCSRLPL